MAESEELTEYNEHKVHHWEEYPEHQHTASYVVRMETLQTPRERGLKKAVDYATEKYHGGAEKMDVDNIPRLKEKKNRIASIIIEGGLIKLISVRCNLTSC